jgi:tRNA (cytidine/uridine-2'-O-)-methyltransferase
VNIVLVTPEIPQNTGNVARTCAALNAELHLVHPLGFAVDDRSLRRAGLDYWGLLTVHHYDSLDEFLELRAGSPLALFSSRGSIPYTDLPYPDDCYLVFGSETSGLPESLLSDPPGKVVRIPTIADARCLNLSNAVAVAAYEVVRQNGFAGLQTRRGPNTPSRD